MSKSPFAVMSSDRAEKTVTYEASFWEGPVQAGQAGRYRRQRFTEQWINRKERGPFPWEPPGGKVIQRGHPLSTAGSVSFYPQLMAAFAKIGCRP